MLPFNTAFYLVLTTIKSTSMSFRGGRGGGGNISSATSDPETAYMRVFVGNINTQNVTKEMLQRMFQKFGFISAVSIHRGFAFVQFQDYYCAQRAANTMNGKLIGDQYADCNLAAEPKPGQKAPAGYEEGGEGWDESYDDSYDVGLAQGWGVGRGGGGYGGGGGFGGGASKRGGGGLGGVRSGRITKHTAKTSYPAKAVLGKSLANLKGLSVASVKSELTQIRNRVNALLQTLNNLPEAKSEEVKTEQQETNGAEAAAVTAES